MKTYRYVYDGAGRLADVYKDDVLQSHYVYDSNGNRTSSTISGVTKVATFDDQDRIVSYGSKTYGYNLNGELISVQDNSTNSSKSFTYNSFGNLKTASVNGKNIEYILDGWNRRIGKKVGGVLKQGFVYRTQLRVDAELDGNNKVVSIFGYEPNKNVPSYVVKGDNNIWYWILSDNIGSVRKVIEVNTGNVVQEMDYDEFGNVIRDTNPGFQPFGFAGGIYDQDTGLVRFGARDYDPEVGRWTSKDPIGFGGGDTNLYGYTFQDPVNFIDPSGLKFEFRDAASQRVFNTLLNSSSLSSANRAMIDKLELSSSTISIGQGAVGTRPFGVSGLTEGFVGNRNSDITIWSAGTGNMDLSILLHELVHANQIDNGTDVLEGPAYQEGGDFLGRCKNGGK